MPKGMAAGLVHIVCTGALDLDIRAAAHTVFVVDAITYMTGQLGHFQHPPCAWFGRYSVRKISFYTALKNDQSGGFEPEKFGNINDKKISKSLDRE